MSVSREDLWSLALGLPEVVEADHHGRPSFRVAGRIIATVPDEHAVNVMVDDDAAHAAAAARPDAVSLLWWGKQLSGVRVDLTAAPEAVVADLLEQAWRRRAPARLRRPVGRAPRDGVT
jgi:hypothetical protein